MKPAQVEAIMRVVYGNEETLHQHGVEGILRRLS